jgi:hypothetical protein
MILVEITALALFTPLIIIASIYASHCTKHFTFINEFESYKISPGKCYYYPKKNCSIVMFKTKNGPRVQN